MKRILFILLVVTASTTVMAGMSTSKVRKETRFLTDKMAYELDLNNPQYNDVYEINYDFIYSLRNIMDYVVRGDEWALDDYYEALDIRNDDLRWVLSDVQYRRFLGAEYFYRPGEDGISGFISIIRIVVYSILVYLIIIGLTVVHIIVRIFIM